MKPGLNKLKDKYLQHSTIRWAAVGISTTIIDFIIFISMYGSTNSVFGSNLISAIFATTFNYLMHHRWTFKSGQKYSNSGFKYLINLFFWWLTSSTIIRLLVSAEIEPRIAKLVPLIFIVPINYFVLNKLVFKKKN